MQLICSMAEVKISRDDPPIQKASKSIDRNLQTQFCININRISSFMRTKTFRRVLVALQYALILNRFKIVQSSFAVSWGQVRTMVPIDGISFELLLNNKSSHFSKFLITITKKLLDCKIFIIFFCSSWISSSFV